MKKLLVSWDFWNFLIALIALLVALYSVWYTKQRDKLSLEITDATFEEATANGVTLTDFWATWCGPCRMQSPVIEQLDQEMGDKVAFNKVDVDENQATAAKFGIMSIPTLLIKKDGQVVNTLVGYHPKEAIEAKLNQYL